MFAPLDPFKTGHLDVGDGHAIYWEAAGNPAGRPALYLHGGPGGGIATGYRRHFDPAQFLIVGFEQRGCGRSLFAERLRANTTPHLIADIEVLRRHLGVSQWLLYGASWGSTLALAYAQAHPAHVSALVLAAVTTTTAFEVDWITAQMRRVFPREWDAYAAAADPAPGQRLIDAYYDRITSADAGVRAAAARAWCTWEDVHMSLAPGAVPNPRYDDPAFREAFASLVIHYWKHAGFVDVQAGMSGITHLPAVLIQGRYDVSSPLEVAWDLHRSWPGSELVVMADEGHGGMAMAQAVTQAVGRV